MAHTSCSAPDPSGGGQGFPGPGFHDIFLVLVVEVAVSVGIESCSMATGPHEEVRWVSRRSGDQKN